MRKVIVLLALLMSLGSIVKGQVYLKSNEHRQRLSNGLNLFYTQIDGASAYEIMLAFRFGATAESEANDGLGYVCHTVFLNGLQNQLQKVDRSIKVDGRYGFEYSTYYFKIPNNQFESALDAIANHYAIPPDSTAIVNAIAQNAALFSIIQHTLLYPAEQELIERQWNVRAPSLSLYGPIPMTDSATVTRAKMLYQEGYCIEFAFMAFNGPLPFRSVWSITQDHLSYVSSCPHKLFNTNLANLFPAPSLSSQLVYSVGTAIPTRYQKNYQGPYLSYDKQGCVATLVLKQLLTNSANFTALCDSLFIDKVLLGYEPMYATSSMTWHIFPNPDSLHLAYTNFDTLVEHLIMGNVFSAQDLETAKQKLISQTDSLMRDKTQKLYLLSKYWNNNTLPWLMEFEQAVKSINNEHIATVLKNYVVEKKYTSLLLLNEADSSKYHYDFFATTYTSIDSIKFHFRRNSATFASVKDDSVFTAFKQTLLINPTLIVAINAQAYKSELLKVKDDSLRNEFSQYEDFYKYPNNLFDDKATFRLDIYRAAVLIGKLLKAGVLPGQLKGTGKILKSSENEAYIIEIVPIFDKKKP